MEDHDDGCALIPFADRGNVNLKLMAEKGLKVVPVASKEVQEMSDKKLNGQAIYQLQKLEGGACSPIQGKRLRLYAGGRHQTPQDILQ